jgi:hypothetical protein
MISGTKHESRIVTIIIIKWKRSMNQNFTVIKFCYYVMGEKEN